MAHAGFAAAVLGATVVTQFSVERDLRMAPGDIEEVSGYRFEMLSIGRNDGPNYTADQAVFSVWQGDTKIAEMTPQKRRYLASGQIMTEAAIDAGFTRDLFIAMGEAVGDDAWAIRLQYKPMIRWIWGGALLMGFGALLTAFDRRYRAKATARQSSTVASGNAGVANAAA
jgi:cytochrome c-type biogenesis protein CcmF